MKTFKISLIVALALLLGLTQCKKKIVEPSTGGEMITVTISAGLGGGNGKTNITEAGKVTWNVGDKIYYGKDASNISVTEVTAVGPNASNVADKIATFTVTVEKGVKYHFYYCGTNAPKSDDESSRTISFAEQVATSSTTDNLTDIATKYHINYGTATLTNSSGVTTIGMNNIMSIGKFNLSDGGFNSDENIVLLGLPNTIQLTFADGAFKVGAMVTEIDPESPTSKTETTYFEEGAKGKIQFNGCGSSDNYKYVALVPASSVDAQADDPIRLLFAGATSLKKRIVDMTTGVQKNQMYVVNSTKDTESFKAFSVGANETVYFAPGNLYYDGSTWNFEKNQYDYRTYYAGKKNNETYKPAVIEGVYGETSTPDGDWGLFGWSTTATSNNWGMHTQTTASDNYTGGVFNDWGENAITYSGTQGTYITSGWFTLSREQWSYLLATRTDYDKKMGEATIVVKDEENKDKNVLGMVLLPDSWTQPSDVTFNYGSKTYKRDSKNLLQTIQGQKYTDNTYTIDEWNKMRANGAVFLPAVGYRNGVNVGDLNVNTQHSYYWTSSTTYSNNGRVLNFYNDNLSNNATTSRCMGAAVRLVHY